ncbi:hypothetical protein [Burkholderia sp. Ac-20365]|uniref:hypothetical protein n=1 Tax=Burkholderia sp. Ac-20365 TaxID=2703897 RepID=UPI00197B81F3|nr:hypothetical protein [Burkholderia sp. Ac-20365]MBN3762516.1 hypothetical protein [Burkholderia sp. Ac-20365]
MKPDCANQVVLFCGHMIDARDRGAERFPARLEKSVAQAIARELDALGVGARDIGLCSGACGSDLLFASAALERQMTLRIYLPFDERRFIEQSVAPGGEHWVAVYRRVTETTGTILADDVTGALPEGVDSFTRNNWLMLSEARAIRASAFRLLCVWDGQRGDGPGGTYDLVKAIEALHGEVRRIDTNELLRAAGM